MVCSEFFFDTFTHDLKPCGICGNWCNVDYQRVKKVCICGNYVAICGNERRSVAKVVAMWQFYYIFVSIRKDL